MSAEPGPREAGHVTPTASSHWLMATCLIGVDYFSTLAYQTSLTFRAAGLLGPLAIVVVVAMTLFGALPVYLYLAGRSPHGQSSFALLERLVRGWVGKTLILFLLGFAATDFLMTKTLSTASAAEHVIHSENAWWQQAVAAATSRVQDAIRQQCGEGVADVFHQQVLVTLALGALSFLFWALIHKGFSHAATRCAVAVVSVYLALNAVVIASGLVYLWQHPAVAQGWWQQVAAGDWHIAARPAGAASPWAIVVMCLLMFPRLALGLSGLEMTIVAMPDVDGGAGDAAQVAASRVRNTRKVMILAAIVMSICLLGSTFVATLLIPAAEFAASGKAADRALAYLAHGGQLTTGDAATAMNPLFGVVFGAAYDVATVLILCLAGTSVITGLTTLLPQLLLRFGMQFKWVHTWGILFGAFALTNLIVTLAFHASVDDQRGAYATGVLMLISSACVVTVVDRWPPPQPYRWLRLPWGYGLITGAFLLTTAVVIVTSPSGILISLCFIVVILASSVLSRALRASELRTLGVEHVDDASRQAWQSVQQLKWPVLVPHRPGRRERCDKVEYLRREHHLAPTVDVVVIEVHLDDPSDFYQTLLLRVFQQDGFYVVHVERGVSVAHAIAAVAAELSRSGCPSALHFGWTELSALAESWAFLAFGEGNVPLKVRELIALEQPDPAKRPRVVVG